MLDWPGLLQDVGVPWRDRGKNTSRGNLNICCPFCGDDHGYHLAISLTKKGYFCYRNPEHRGKSAPYLLQTLGIHNTEIGNLLERYSDGQDEYREAREYKPIVDMSNPWRAFSPLTEPGSGPYLRYLQGRGFIAAKEVATEYGLRFSPVGKWAARILLPIRHGPKVIAWTGRDIRPQPRLKYMTSESLNSSMIYVPRPTAMRTAVIVEGPLDALKIVAATRNVMAIGMLGKHLSADRIVAIRDATKKCERILFAPDADVGIERFAMLAELQVALQGVQLISLPDAYKDAGEMPLFDIRYWLGER